MRPLQQSHRSPISHRHHRRENRTHWRQAPPPYDYNHQGPRNGKPLKLTRPPPPRPLRNPPSHRRQSPRSEAPPAELRDYSPSSPYYSPVSPNYCARYYYSPPDDVPAGYSSSWSPVYASPSPVYLPPPPLSSSLNVPPCSPLSPVHSPSFSPSSPLCSPPYLPYTPPRVISAPSSAVDYCQGLFV